MLRRNTFAQNTWNQFTWALDERIAAAAERLIKDRALTPDDLAGGFEELSRFRTPGGDDPDYNRRGLSVAYLLHNQGMRTSSLALALHSMVPNLSGLNLLDIGSGLDASALAIELATEARDVTLVGSEPSHEMRSAAEWITVTEQRVRRSRLSLTLQQLLEPGGVDASQQYDGVILSASLEHGFASGWSDGDLRAAGRALASMLTPRGFLLAAEPGGRRALAERLHRALELGGLQSEVVPSTAIVPQGVALARRLNRTTEVLESIGAAVLAANPVSRRASMMFIDRWTQKIAPVLSWSSSTQIHYVVGRRKG